MIGICLPNIPEYAVALLGAAEAGLVTTTINPIYTAGKIEFFSFLISITRNIFLFDSRNISSTHFE